ncbi:TFIIH subunit Tfb4/p34 [Astrocystis sublimbata]|nr:TFIIH subunit Tfb4/p34 [Astrocystis sublimbata]
MNRIDASEHYDESSFAGQTPSLLTVIVDTNPRAWAALSHILTLPQAISNILVFINAHLAYGNENQVAVLAAHTQRAVWLYPTPANNTTGHHARRNNHHPRRSSARDVAMTGVDGFGSKPVVTSANKYPQFAKIESSILASLRSLIDDTTDSQLDDPNTLLSGAVSMALSYIHKTSLAFEPPKTSQDAADPKTAPSTTPSQPNMHARILVLSVSPSSPSQYITTMNAVFAASHARIPIDTLALYSAPTFLQQAAFITGGTFLSATPTPTPTPTTTSTSNNNNNNSSISASPRGSTPGLLTHLLFGLLADASARAALVAPSMDSVDFRAACFCHRNVVDTGFVCSICLSIFCHVPQDGVCATCETKLALGNYGARPAVVARRRKKKGKKGGRDSVGGVGVNGNGAREETGSAAGTPGPG